jgi:hypothetical protein
LVALRYSGISFARYFMPPDFSADDFDGFVQRLDEDLLMSAPEMLNEFHALLDEHNSPAGIAAEDTFKFRLLEYGRQRAVSLQKQGCFDVLISNDEPATEIARAVRSAFELGCATAEYRVLNYYEEYVYDGIAQSEWREEGLPRAREERLRQGRRTRTAILNAAKELYAKSPELIRNDSETARRILKLKLPDLQKGNGTQIGFDCITRHLREARQCTRSCSAVTESAA